MRELFALICIKMEYLISKQIVGTESIYVSDVNLKCASSAMAQLGSFCKSCT